MSEEMQVSYQHSLIMNTIQVMNLVNDECSFVSNDIEVFGKIFNP